MVAQGQPRVAPQPMGGSAAPHRKGKTTSYSSAHDKPKKKVSLPEQVVQKPKKSIWVTPNRYAYQPKAKTPPQCLDSNFVLQHNGKGDVFAKFIGNGRNVYHNTFI